MIFFAHFVCEEKEISHQLWSLLTHITQLVRSPGRCPRTPGDIPATAPAQIPPADRPHRGRLDRDYDTFIEHLPKGH